MAFPESWRFNLYSTGAAYVYEAAFDGTESDVDRFIAKWGATGGLTTAATADTPTKRGTADNAVKTFYVKNTDATTPDVWENLNADIDTIETALDAEDTLIAAAMASGGDILTDAAAKGLNATIGEP